MSENKLERLADWPLVEIIGGVLMAVVSIIGASIGNGLMTAAILFAAFLWHSAYTQIRDGLIRRRYGRKKNDAKN